LHIHDVVERLDALVTHGGDQFERHLRARGGDGRIVDVIEVTRHGLHREGVRRALQLLQVVDRPTEGCGEVGAIRGIRLLHARSDPGAGDALDGTDQGNGHYLPI
jgi:hypothetical protein